MTFQGLMCQPKFALIYNVITSACACKGTGIRPVPSYYPVLDLSGMCSFTVLCLISGW